MKHLLTFSLLLLFLPFGYSQNWNPQPNWKDSYEANGHCWCESTFDHDLDDKKVLINGVPYSVVDICDELENHPDYRTFDNDDPAFNDIQCGNGPFNNAADESGCPGRVDLGSSGCDQIGVTWDMDWLAGRQRFKGDTPPDPLAIPGRIEAENFIVDSGLKTESHNDQGGSQGIGSIHSGDHVDYSVDIAAAGAYEVQVRYSSNTQGGTLTFLVDDEAVSTMSLDGTGGWNQWETSATTSLELPAGEHLLRVRFTGASGFLVNVNWLDISGLSTGQGQVVPALPLRIFPNPTRGELTLSGEGLAPGVQAEVYSMQGVRLFTTPLENNSIDISHLPTNMYLVRVQGSERTWQGTVTVE
jgi:hypothetical protein